MRNNLQPTIMAELAAKIGKFDGMDIIYFHPNDIDMENDKINAKSFIGDKWVSVETGIPKLIDISPFCFKFSNVTKYLRSKAVLTDNGLNRISKEELQEILLKDEVYSRYVIPTKPIEAFSDIEMFLQEHKEIVVKPVYSQRGQGVYRIKKNKDNYSVGFKTTEKTMDSSELETLYEDEIKDAKHIAQKFVYSRTKNDDPFDCRIHTEKDRNGKWQIARIYVRIGIGQKVISNVNQGGGIADVVPFLKANFPNWTAIHEKLKSFGKSFPYKMETIRKTNLMTLGVDIGIDKDGELYIFEANSAPATNSIKAEVTLLRCGYYQHLIETKVK